MHSNPEIKARARQVVVKYSIILGVGVAYLIFFLCVGFGIPCVFREITGLKCPGCGISKMFVSLARFDFAAAFRHNPLIFTTSPLLLAYLATSEIKYIRYGNRDMGKWEPFMWVELALLLVYGVLRNIFPI